MYAATGRTEASYFVMLADIVSSRETADRVYQLLLGRGQGVAVTWDTLFDRFQVHTSIVLKGYSCLKPRPYTHRTRKPGGRMDAGPTRDGAASAATDVQSGTTQRSRPHGARIH